MMNRIFLKETARVRECLEVDSFGFFGHCNILHWQTIGHVAAMFTLTKSAIGFWCFFLFPAQLNINLYVFCRFQTKFLDEFLLRSSTDTHMLLLVRVKINATKFTQKCCFLEKNLIKCMHLYLFGNGTRIQSKWESREGSHWENGLISLENWKQLLKPDESRTKTTDGCISRVLTPLHTDTNSSSPAFTRLNNGTARKTKHLGATPPDGQIRRQAKFTNENAFNRDCGKQQDLTSQPKVGLAEFCRRFLLCLLFSGSRSPHSRQLLFSRQRSAMKPCRTILKIKSRHFSLIRKIWPELDQNNPNYWIIKHMMCLMQWMIRF